MAKSKKAPGKKRRGSAKASTAHRSHNVPILPVIGIASGIGIPALTSFQGTKGAPTAQRASMILDSIGSSIYGYSAISGQWNLSALPGFWAPVAGSAIAHKVVTKLGVNRILTAAKMGFTL